MSLLLKSRPDLETVCKYNKTEICGWLKSCLGVQISIKDLLVSDDFDMAVICCCACSMVMYETGAVSSHARSLWKLEHIRTKYVQSTELIIVTGRIDRRTNRVVGNILYWGLSEHARYKGFPVL